MPQAGPGARDPASSDVGTWDATVEAWLAPNTPPSISKGVNEGRMLGGFWLIDDFKSEFLGHALRRARHHGLRRRQEEVRRHVGGLDVTRPQHLGEHLGREDEDA